MICSDSSLQKREALATDRIFSDAGYQIAPRRKNDQKYNSVKKAEHFRFQHVPRIGFYINLLCESPGRRARLIAILLSNRFTVHFQRYRVTKHKTALERQIYT